MNRRIYACIASMVVLILAAPACENPDAQRKSQTASDGPSEGSTEDKSEGSTEDKYEDGSADPASDDEVIVARVLEDGKHGYIGLDGEYVIERRFSMAYPFRKGYASVIDGAEPVEGSRGRAAFGGERYLIDPSGERASYTFENGAWHGDLLMTVEGFGSPRALRTREGDIVARGFDEIGEFREGRAVAVKDGRIGWIDTEGQWTTSFPREEMQGLCPVWSGVACAVTAEQKCGFIDPDSGDWILAAEYVSCGHFREGRAFAGVEDEDADGLIDRQGNWIVRDEFDDHLVFFEKRAFVEKDGRWGMIDRDGRWIVEPTFASAGGFSGGLAPVEDVDTGLYGFIDRSGEIVIEPQFEEIGRFHHGLAHASRPGEKFGFIDESGEFVIPPRFTTVHAFGDVNSSRQDY